MRELDPLKVKPVPVTKIQTRKGALARAAQITGLAVKIKYGSFGPYAFEVGTQVRERRWYWPLKGSWFIPFAKGSYGKWDPCVVTVCHHTENVLGQLQIFCGALSEVANCNVELRLYD